MSTFSSSSVVPRILLTPALAAWAPLFAGYHVYLSANAAFSRNSTKQYLTQPDDETSPQVVANRCFGNYIEYVPTALLLAGVCELNGAPPLAINLALGALFVARVAHAELGLKWPGHLERLKNDGVQFGRVSGFLGSNAIIAALGGYAFYLCFDGIKVMYGF